MPVKVGLFDAGHGLDSGITYIARSLQVATAVQV
jgi:hypothetical protein